MVKSHRRENKRWLLCYNGTVYHRKSVLTVLTTNLIDTRTTNMAWKQTFTYKQIIQMYLLF